MMYEEDIQKVNEWFDAHTEATNRIRVEVRKDMVQLTFTDLFTDCGQPDWPDCWKTCANFSNEFADGHKDYFMDWRRGVPDLNSPRCVRHEGKPKLINNVWHMPCKRYEPIT